MVLASGELRQSSVGRALLARGHAERVLATDLLECRGATEGALLLRARARVAALGACLAELDLKAAAAAGFAVRAQTGCSGACAADHHRASAVGSRQAQERAAPSVRTSAVDPRIERRVAARPPGENDAARDHERHEKSRPEPHQKAPPMVKAAPGPIGTTPTTTFVSGLFG